MMSLFIHALNFFATFLQKKQKQSTNLKKPLKNGSC